MKREGSKDETNTRAGNIDTSALPSTASWANREAAATTTKVRRPSQSAGRASTSPRVPSAPPPSKRAEEAARPESEASSPIPQPTVSSRESKSQPPPEKQASRPSSSGRSSPKAKEAQNSLFDKLVTNVNSPGFRFSFDANAFTNDELAAIERCPTMIDPYGGVKRRLMREKEAERLRQQIEAQAKLQPLPVSGHPTADDENVESGSLALGGEPDEGSRTFSAGSAIQRPSQSANASSSLNDQFSNLGINPRSLTPQQRQQLAHLSSGNVQQAPGLGQPNQQGFGLGSFDEQRLSAFQNHPNESNSGHGRQSSRYSFANDSVKSNPAPRFPNQQQSGGAPQHFYTSGVQGPPPGLKTAGTPPISGGGMFAQGHGFTSNMNAGFGAAKDANTDMLARARSGTGSGHDVSKREYLLSLQNNSHRSPPAQAPAPGLLHSLYGPYSGTYQDPGLVKQKKKGKKHRHANTSSSGGGVVDLADPSVLQARLHQNASGVGQGLFGGQNQGGYNQSNNMYGGGYGRW
jgi:CCR4-NOT transcription complex subunit 4